MKYKYKDLKPGMILFRDREEDVYDDDLYFAYIEVITIIDIEDNEVEMKRQHIYIYDDLTIDNDEEWGKVFRGRCSSSDPMLMRDSHWDSGWSHLDFYTEREIKQRIITHCFNI